MFEYAKMKTELEEIKCPVHAKTATAVIANGKVKFENVCCDEHRKALQAALPDEIEQQSVEDIVAEIY